MLSNIFDNYGQFGLHSIVQVCYTSRSYFSGVYATCIDLYGLFYKYIIPIIHNFSCCTFEMKTITKLSGDGEISHT